MIRIHYLTGFINSLASGFSETEDPLKVGDGKASKVFIIIYIIIITVIWEEGPRLISAVFGVRRLRSSRVVQTDHHS